MMEYFHVSVSEQVLCLMDVFVNTIIARISLVIISKSARKVCERSSSRCVSITVM